MWLVAKNQQIFSPAGGWEWGSERAPSTWDFKPCTQSTEAEAPSVGKPLAFPVRALNLHRTALFWYGGAESLHQTAQPELLGMGLKVPTGGSLFLPHAGTLYPVLGSSGWHAQCRETEDPSLRAGGTFSVSCDDFNPCIEQDSLSQGNRGEAPLAGLLSAGKQRLSAKGAFGFFHQIL